MIDPFIEIVIYGVILIFAFLCLSSTYDDIRKGG
jgi:hypothetical protein